MSLAEDLKEIRSYIEVADLSKGVSLLGEALKQEYIDEFDRVLVRNLRDEYIGLAASISNFLQEERMGMRPSENERNRIITRFLKVLNNIEELIIDRKNKNSSLPSKQLRNKFSQLKEWGEVIISRPASEEQKFWHEYLRTSRQEEPKRLEDTAKFLAGMVSIIFTILLSIDKTFLQGKFPVFQVFIAVLWLISLLLCFIVILPRPYKTVKESAEAIKRMHMEVLKWKASLLTGAIISFLLGFGLLIFIYISVALT